MSKIVCEVCGTSYPETATQCPICGYANKGNSQSVAGDSVLENYEENNYNYVKGGRFSKANVRKRNKAYQQASGREPVQDMNESGNGGGKKPVGLIVTAVVLLLAILAVVIYIAVRFFGPGGMLPSTEPSSIPAASQQSESTAESSSVPALIPCKSIKLDVTNIQMDKVNAARMIYVKPSPENTTDKVEFSSANEDVAVVTKDGKVISVGPGETIITVTCGQAKAQCKVVCKVQEVTEPSTEPSVPATTEVKEKGTLRLNREDITFSRKGESWELYNGTIGKPAITWSSDNKNVATFENGKVVAVGSGTTKVHAEYNGQKVSCIIRCSFKSGGGSGIEGNGGGITEDGGSRIPSESRGPAESSVPETSTVPSSSVPETSSGPAVSSESSGSIAHSDR